MISGALKWDITYNNDNVTISIHLTSLLIVLLLVQYGSSSGLAPSAWVSQRAKFYD